MSLSLYKPWGESRGGAGTRLTDYGFTGQRKMGDGVGLIYYGAGFYDPALGRFAQPDTIVPQASQGVQAWDRFAYVNNSPIGNSDPSGHCPICITAVIGGAAGAIVGAVGYTVYAAANQQQFNTGTMLAVAGGGAVAGALLGTGVGIAAGVGVAEATAASVTIAGVAETANTACGGDMCAGEIQDSSKIMQEAGPTIAKVLPAAQNEVSQVSNAINTGTNTVYQFVENNAVKYYGITNDFTRRASEHLAERGWQIQKIPGLGSLSRFDARAVEQALIEKVGLPNLTNKINSIASSNPIYNTAIQRGEEILNLIGY